jgi:hypothetical protein
MIICGTMYLSLYLVIDLGNVYQPIEHISFPFFLVWSTVVNFAAFDNNVELEDYYTKHVVVFPIRYNDRWIMSA